jgi:hypothetical protein
VKNPKNLQMYLWKKSLSMCMLMYDAYTLVTFLGTTEMNSRKTILSVYNNLDKTVRNCQAVIITLDPLLTAF